MASNVVIRGLYMFTTALKQPDVQQIMSGECVCLAPCVCVCVCLRACIALFPADVVLAAIVTVIVTAIAIVVGCGCGLQTGNFGVYACPLATYCPGNSTAPAGSCCAWPAQIGCCDRPRSVCGVGRLLLSRQQHQRGWHK